MILFIIFVIKFEDKLKYFEPRLFQQHSSRNTRELNSVHSVDVSLVESLQRFPLQFESCRHEPRV